MSRFPGPRTNLSDSAQRQLNMYALAAGAAGVGMLATVGSAEGKIVYTPAHISIAPNGAHVGLDLNHDGIRDFKFHAFYELTHSGFFRSSLVATPGPQPNRIWATHTTRGSVCAAALPAGRTVGRKSPFQPGHSRMTMARASGETSVGSATVCPWVKVTQAYLGLKFVIQGRIHFGWARVKMLRGAGFPAVITGYAYETIPGKSIVTGKTKSPAGLGIKESDATLAAPALQPSSLGMLALGAPLQSIGRR